MRYFVQFTAGTGGLVRDALAARLDRLRVAYADDSAMILDSTTAPAAVAAVPFLKNAFVVVAATERRDLAKSVARLSQGLRRDQFPLAPGAVRPVPADGSSRRRPGADRAAGARRRWSARSPATPGPGWSPVGWVRSTG